MKHLLDTAPLLYLLQGDETRVPSLVRKIVKSTENELLVSTASLWEISIKSSIGKLHFVKPAHLIIPSFLEKLNIQILPIRTEDALGVEQLHFHHKDPFDRMLATQALNEKLPLITPDRIFKKYGVKVVW